MLLAFNRWDGAMTWNCPYCLLAYYQWTDIWLYWFPELLCFDHQLSTFISLLYLNWLFYLLILLNQYSDYFSTISVEKLALFWQLLISFAGNPQLQHIFTTVVEQQQYTTNTVHLKINTILMSMNVARVVKQILKNLSFKIIHHFRLQIVLFRISLSKHKPLFMLLCSFTALGPNVH